MISLINKVRKDGDSLGGKITGIALNVPPGWGEPVFDKLHADLAKAMLSINAVKGFNYGLNHLDISECLGSEVNDVIKNIGTDLGEDSVFDFLPGIGWLVAAGARRRRPRR